MEADLTRERGLWGPPSSSQLDKWALDMVEGKTLCVVIHQEICSPSSHYSDILKEWKFSTTGLRPARVVLNKTFKEVGLSYSEHSSPATCHKRVLD